MIARILLSLMLAATATQAWAARDAAFLAPSSAASGAGQDEIKIEPKSDVDLGDTGVNISRRSTFFFVNVSATPIDIIDATANGDSNVRAVVVDDDCTKQGKIAVNSRCSISVETTPSGAGPWTAELLLMHKGAGRMARARISGRTTGGAGDRREAGLSLSSKDVKPVDFGDVEVGTDKAVRTALMVNDSNDPISILSVDVIAAENGLEKLEQGCIPDMDLKPGESCPVTMIWKPTAKGIISTDLIIRHSGRQGFAVIPVRGNAKEGAGHAGGDMGAAGKGSSSASSSKIPLSPTADELEKMIAGQVAPLSSDALKPTTSGSAPTAFRSRGNPVASALGLHLIGTVGNRGVFYVDDDGSSVVAALGEDIVVGGKTAKVMSVSAKSAELYVDGKKKVLTLEAVGALTTRASTSAPSEPPPAAKGAKTSAPSSVQLPMGR